MFLIKLALVGYEMIIANSYPTCTCARMTDQPPFPGGQNFLWWPIRGSSVWNGNLFKGLGIWKGRDFTCCSKYMKGSGNLSFWLVQRPKWANRFILWSWKGQEKVLLFFIYSYFKDIAFTVVKRDEQFLTRYVKGAPFVNRRYMLQVKIKSRLKFFNLRWFTNSFVY